MQIRGTSNQAYVFRAGSGQTVKIQLASKAKRATLDLLDAQGSDLSEGSDGRNLEITTGEAGDYRLNIQAPKGVAFTLTISIK